MATKKDDKTNVRPINLPANKQEDQTGIIVAEGRRACSLARQGEQLLGLAEQMMAHSCMRALITGEVLTPYLPEGMKHPTVADMMKAKHATGRDTAEVIKNLNSVFPLFILGEVPELPQGDSDAKAKAMLQRTADVQTCRRGVSLAWIMFKLGVNVEKAWAIDSKGQPQGFRVPRSALCKKNQSPITETDCLLDGRGIIVNTTTERGEAISRIKASVRQLRNAQQDKAGRAPRQTTGATLAARGPEEIAKAVNALCETYEKDAGAVKQAELNTLSQLHASLGVYLDKINAKRRAIASAPNASNQGKGEVA